MGRRFNPIAAPFRTAHRVLQQIPNPRLRAALSFALAFAVSLGVGRAFEVVLSDEQVKAAEKTQKEWIDSLKSFAPLSLIKGYADDVSKVMAGELVYVPPPPPPAPLTAEELAEINDSAARAAACNLARARAAPPPMSNACLSIRMSGLSHADCLANPDKPGCAALNACVEEEESLFSGPPECVGVGNSLLGGSLSASMTASLPPIAPTPLPGEYRGKSIPIYLAPLFALFRAATRIIGENGVAPFVAFGQIVIGTLVFFVISNIGSKGAHLGFDNWIANLLLAPACIVGLASVSALVIQWLMIGALGAFSWATSLAAACCGTSSIGAGVWYCLKKLGEKGVESAITGGTR
jgi:hypothetical protein